MLMNKKLSLECCCSSLLSLIVPPPSMSCPGKQSPAATSLSPYCQKVELKSKLSEVDRAFFTVLNLDFSLYSEPAETGYYYDCECDDSFNSERFRMAAQQFVYYRCHRALRANDKVRVKYVDLSDLVASKVLSSDQAASIVLCLQQEFEFLSRVSALKAVGSGLVDVFLIAARSPLVYYMFLEKPDETLAEYLRRTGSSSITSPFADSDQSSVSVKSTHWRPSEVHIPLVEAKLILHSVASTVLQLHRSGLIHGFLTPGAIFIFRRVGKSQSAAKKSDSPIEAVKLANFTFASRIEPSQEAVGLSLRTVEISALHEIASQVAENTAFASPDERTTFLAAVRYLDVASEEDELLPNDRKTPDSVETALKLFVGFMAR